MSKTVKYYCTAISSPDLVSANDTANIFFQSIPQSLASVSWSLFTIYIGFEENGTHAYAQTSVSDTSDFDPFLSALVDGVSRWASIALSSPTRLSAAYMYGGISYTYKYNSNALGASINFQSKSSAVASAIIRGAPVSLVARESLSEYGDNLLLHSLSRSFPVSLSETSSYIELTISNEGPLVTTHTSPGRVADNKSTIRFAWQTNYENFPIVDFTISNTQLQWKNGENGTITSIGLGSGVTSYTMPANTMPASQALYWRVSVVTSSGNSVSEWAKLQTADSTPVVTALSPAGTFVNKDSATDFSWDYDIDTGTAQTAYEIQIKTASGDWTTIASASSAATTATIPAGTLPSGTIQWRVRAKNSDSIASEWSAPLSIIVIGAPDTPTLSVKTISPRPEIAWAALDQQAYQVQMGENDSGLIWGTAKSYKSPWYLSAGVNLLRVRVMNQYNMWSAWAAANVTITNSSASATLTLTGTADSDVALSWTAISGAAGYHVYRDGKKIAEVTEASYVDRYSIGSTRYFVRAVYADDSSTDSNDVTLRPTVRWPRITAEDGDWIDLRFSAESLPASSIVTSCDVSLMQYSGAVYPVPEASAHRERTYSINAAFPRGREAAFEALLGRRVWLKDEYDNIIYGIMSTVTKAQNVFYTTFSAVISEVEHEDA